MRTILLIALLGLSTCLIAQPAAKPPTAAQKAADQALTEACVKNDIDAARKALNAGANVNTMDSRASTPLMLAAAKANFDFMHLLIKAGANPVLQDDQGHSAHELIGIDNLESDVKLSAAEAMASSAVKEKEKEALIRLAAPAGMLAEALISAVIARDTAKVAALLSQGAYVDFKDKRLADEATSLVIAATNGDTEILTLLLSKNPRLERTNKLGRTPLLSAAGAGYAKAVEILIKAGAYVGASDREGMTPLSATAVTGQVECAKLLLSNKADVNDRNFKTNATALVYATANKHPELVPILLKAGADVNVQESQGATALMFAVADGDLATVNMLLQSGAKTDLKTKDGLTALDIAKQSKNAAVIQALTSVPQKPGP